MSGQTLLYKYKDRFFFWQTFHVQQTIQQKTDAPTIQNITIEKNEHITKNTIQSLNKNKKYIIKIKDK